MNNDKITASHLERIAFIYIRQSTLSQVENNRESTDRQYKLVDRAQALGWPMDRIQVIDEDLAHSANGTVKRNGFDSIFNAVAMRSAGLVLAIEVSRLARNNSDWYRLLDLSGTMDCLIGDEDGLYHPGLFNDRLLLGMKGTMAEAELHVLRARLNGGIRNKAARGELRRGLPIGFVWGQQDGEILFDPNQAVKEAIALVFKLFSQLGSVRRVWLHFQTEELELPSRRSPYSEISWTIPTYHAINAILGNPVYAGVYAFGRSRQESYLNEHGELKKRVVKLPREKWAVFIQEHHEGFIDWETYQMNRKRIDNNTRPGPHKVGAVREGAALLQGLATCGGCARRLRVYYQGQKASPGYHCPGNDFVNGRAHWCLRIGAGRIDNAVSEALIESIKPAGIQAALPYVRKINYSQSIKQA